MRGIVNAVIAAAILAAQNVKDLAAVTPEDLMGTSCDASAPPTSTDVW